MKKLVKLTVRQWLTEKFGDSIEDARKCDIRVLAKECGCSVSRMRAVLRDMLFKKAHNIKPKSKPSKPSKSKYRTLTDIEKLYNHLLKMRWIGEKLINDGILTNEKLKISD